MASNITVGGADVSVWTTYIIKQLVPGLKAELNFADYAEPATLPRGAGGYVARWLVPQMRVGSTTALTDGSSGSATDMVTISGVEATIADYGEWMNISDLANETDISTALDGYKDIIQYAGAAAIDTLIYNAGIAGTNFLHCGDTTTGGTTLAAGDQLKAKDFPVIGGFFRTQNAKGWDKLSGDFMLSIDPDVSEISLTTDVTTGALSWSEVNKHVPVGFEQLINNHRFVGRLNGVTALRTTIIKQDTEDVQAKFCVALARYGVGWLGLGQGGPKAPQVIMKQPGPQSTNDPLNTNNTLGWKVRAVARNLDVARALTVYSAVDAS